MGLLDYIFGKKKQKERLQKERQTEQEQLHLAEETRIAEEREARLAKNRKKEEIRQAQLKAQRESEEDKAKLKKTSLKTNAKEMVINQEDLMIDQEALDAYERRDYNTAISKYTTLIERNSGAFQYYKFRGTVYEDMGNENLAFKDFSKAVELCPTDAVALYRLAMAYHRKNDMKTAIKYLEEAYKCSPTYDNLMGNLYNNILFVHKRVIAGNLANFLTQSNRVEEGLNMLNEVISNCPDYSFPYYVKAITLANKGDLENAASSARKALELGHTQAKALLDQINAMLPSSPSNSRDQYSDMVDKASFNPFNITTAKAFQNANHLPDLKGVFVNELSMSFSTLMGHMDEQTILSSYVFNLAESYYKNAGYIPKNTLDEIIVAVYSAYQSTDYYNSKITLDTFKNKVYFTLLNR